MWRKLQTQLVQQWSISLLTRAKATYLLRHSQMNSTVYGTALATVLSKLPMLLCRGVKATETTGQIINTKKRKGLLPAESAMEFISCSVHRAYFFCSLSCECFFVQR